MVTGDSTSEAHKVIHDADNVFVLNRSMQDEMNGVMYAVLDKSISGQKNIIYKMKTCFPRMMTHDKSLGYEVVKGGQPSGFTNDATNTILRKAAAKADE